MSRTGPGSRGRLLVAFITSAIMTQVVGLVLAPGSQVSCRTRLFTPIRALRENPSCLATESRLKIRLVRVWSGRARESVPVQV